MGSEFMRFFRILPQVSFQVSLNLLQPLAPAVTSLGALGALGPFAAGQLGLLALVESVVGGPDWGRSSPFGKIKKNMHKHINYTMHVDV